MLESAASSAGRAHRLRYLRREQLDEIGKPLPSLPFTQHWPLAQLDRALAQLPEVQPIGRLTGCTHAAAWISPEGDLS